jgi:hypothetical protein
MRHDRPPPTPKRRARESDRKEWSRNREHKHQFEAREHARLPGKPRRRQGILDAEAELQIRELRARY